MRAYALLQLLCSWERLAACLSRYGWFGLFIRSKVATHDHAVMWVHVYFRRRLLLDKELPYHVSHALRKLSPMMRAQPC